MDTMDKFLWYEREITKGRRERERLWTSYYACQQKLDRLECESAALVKKMMQETRERSLSADDIKSQNG